MTMREISPESPGFRDYMLGRRHDLSSRSRPSWAFVMHVLANPDFPQVTTLRDLQRHLEETGVSPEVAQSAHSAWKSFLAHKCRQRAKGAASFPWGEGSRAGRAAAI